MTESEKIKRADALARERTMSKRCDRDNAYRKYRWWDDEYRRAYIAEYKKIMAELGGTE